MQYHAHHPLKCCIPDSRRQSPCDRGSCRNSDRSVPCNAEYGQKSECRYFRYLKTVRRFSSVQPYLCSAFPGVAAEEGRYPAFHKVPCASQSISGCNPRIRSVERHSHNRWLSAEIYCCSLHRPYIRNLCRRGTYRN